VNLLYCKINHNCSNVLHTQQHKVCNTGRIMG